MKTLKESKDDYARFLGYDNWFELYRKEPHQLWEMHNDHAAERFANAKAKALLEEAAEKATVKFEYDYNDDEVAVVDKQSILSLIPNTETK